MRTGSVTLCRLSSSNSTVGWLRLVVSAQIQITLCKYYVIASESFRITNLPSQTKTVPTGGRRYKPRQFFFQCDENVETDKSFGEILWAFEEAEGAL